MTDASGAVVWAAAYKPFGEVNITTNTITNNLRFPGQYFGSETSLHYNYYRDYNPVIGRYVQSDPIGQGGGINLYRYVGNPISIVDPLGLFGTSDFVNHYRNERIRERKTFRIMLHYEILNLFENKGIYDMKTTRGECQLDKNYTRERKKVSS